MAAGGTPACRPSVVPAGLDSSGPWSCALSTVLRLPPAHKLHFSLTSHSCHWKDSHVQLPCFSTLSASASSAPRSLLFQVLEMCLHLGDPPFPSGSGHPWCDPPKQGSPPTRALVRNADAQAPSHTHWSSSLMLTTASVPRSFWGRKERSVTHRPPRHATTGYRQNNTTTGKLGKEFWY